MTDQEPMFVVRLWDMFDGWMDITEPITLDEANSKWAEETSDGTRNTQYSDGDYYAIFPSDTRMMFTPESMGR